MPLEVRRLIAVDILTPLDGLPTPENERVDLLRLVEGLKGEQRM